MDYENNENFENISEGTTVVQHIISSALEGYDSIESVKSVLGDIINEASAQLSAFTDDNIDEVTELTEEQSDSTEGGFIAFDTSMGNGSFTITRRRGTQATQGSMSATKVVDCLQSAWIMGGNAKGLKNIKKPSGVSVYISGNYVYIRRKNLSIKGVVKGTVAGYFNDVNFTWYLK